ncbi:unnamed protein product, partial [Amoebophrya sp. A25]|eukprot:GSA25T00023216001.1
MDRDWMHMVNRASLHLTRLRQMNAARTAGNDQHVAGRQTVEVAGERLGVSSVDDRSMETTYGTGIPTTTTSSRCSSPTDTSSDFGLSASTDSTASPSMRSTTTTFDFHSPSPSTSASSWVREDRGVPPVRMPPGGVDIDTFRVAELRRIAESIAEAHEAESSASASGIFGGGLCSSNSSFTSTSASPSNGVSSSQLGSSAFSGGVVTADHTTSYLHTMNMNDSRMMN